MASVDIWVTVGAPLLLVPMPLWRGRIGRPVAGLFLLGYAYLVVLF